MKEEIYTIPVMDGFNQKTECPFCAMYQKLNRDTVAFVLSPSYMEEDVRGETNKKGFCKAHIQELYDSGNVLGLALMMHSHLKERMTELDAAAGNTSAAPKKWLGKKKTEGENPIAALRQRYANSCYLCDRIQTSFDRYFSTFFYLWKKQESFRSIVSEGTGYCIDHYLRLLDEAQEYLHGQELEAFLAELKKQEQENLARVADELEWFTLKFDYRYKDKPWNNSKDALPRTILKVTSRNVEKQNPEK